MANKLLVKKCLHTDVCITHLLLTYSSVFLESSLGNNHNSRNPGLRHGPINAVNCACPQHVSHPPPSMARWMEMGLMPTCPGRVKHVDMHAFPGVH